MEYYYSEYAQQEREGIKIPHTVYHTKTHTIIQEYAQEEREGIKIHPHITNESIDV